MKRRFVLGPLLIFALASVAQATTLLRVPLEEMARSSDLIVHAVVEKVRVVAAPDDERHITTKVRLRVIRTLKGHHTAPTLTLVLPGGQTERWAMLIPGMPQFREGEEVVLFLELTSAGFRPAGLSLGTFRVQKDPKTGRMRAKRTVQGALVIDRSPDGRLFTESGPISHADDEMDLEVLYQRVEKALKEGGKP